MIETQRDRSSHLTQLLPWDTIGDTEQLFEPSNVAELCG